MEPYLQLEQEWAAFNDLDPAGMVACSSGTAAIHLALESLQLPQGGEVITSDFNMIAVPRAIAMANLVPVFIDCDERLLIDFSWMPMTMPYPAAIIATHIYGRRCDMEFFDGAEEDEFTKHKTYLIEDLAEAHGVKPYYQTDAACWSFYKNKIVAGEEGGAVWFRNNDHAKLARQLRSLGFTDSHDFNHVPRGHNYRMSNAHARIILDRETNRWGSIGDLIDNLNKRREIERRYDIFPTLPLVYQQPLRDVPWVYDLRIKGMTSETQTKLVKALNNAGIAARHAFKPMSHQPEFSKCKAFGPARRWNSCMAAKEVIYLPIQPGVTTDSDIDKSFRIIDKEVDI